LVPLPIFSPGAISCSASVVIALIPKRYQLRNEHRLIADATRDERRALEIPHRGGVVALLVVQPRAGTISNARCRCGLKSGSKV
jgi:hypothetical protein